MCLFRKLVFPKNRSSFATIGLQKTLVAAKGMEGEGVLMVFQAWQLHLSSFRLFPKKRMCKTMLESWFSKQIAFVFQHIVFQKKNVVCKATWKSWVSNKIVFAFQ